MSFYHDLKELQTQYADADFGFLEDINDGTHNAYEFLHGYCHVFAYVLSKNKGYPIIMKKDMSMTDFIHVWCFDDQSFIDVRGKTNNVQKFWDEFEDFSSFDDFSNLSFLNPDELYCYLDSAYFSDSLINFAQKLIDDYPEYY